MSKYFSMKKLFLVFSILCSLNSFAQPGTYSGTFIVDLSLYSGTISNVAFVRGTQSSAMTSIGNNQYSYNFSSFLTSPTIYYKFKVNGVVEFFSVTNSCLFTNPSTNDISRFINLSTTTPSIVCWQSCSPCVTTVPGCTDTTANNYNPLANLDDGSCEYNVTFYVDMSEANQVFDTVEVNGTFNSWCGNCAQMTDANNDDLWEIIIPLTSGSYQYKFSADDWNIQENLFESDDCVVGSPPNINRSLVVTGNQVLDTVCWNRCYSCDTERNFYNVTFQIDMSNVTNAFTTPEVNGSFNNWCGNCWALDNQGNNIFSKSFNIDTSFHEFKFSADNWGIQEELDSSLSCILINYDPLALNGWGYVNRLLQLTSDTLIDVCWQSCGPCIIYGCTDSLACNYNSTATVDDGSCLLIYGCMNPTALNFNPLATCPDSCSFFQIIFGCIDILACNYDFLANTDDGSCLLNYGCMDLLAFNYDSLATCFDSSCVYEYHVTFQLDLRNQTSISYTTPELNGTFNGWCGNCAPMTDANNDSIWEITVPILEGSGPVSGVPGWEYKFSADNWNIQENLFSGDPCTYSASGFTNRYLNVTQDTILDPVCWESCVDCFGPQSSYNVTFQIDMTNVTGFSVPEVNGEFNNWCGNCWPMTDINGDNIWEFTTLIDTSLHEYKFSADTWSIQEYLDSSLSCILINYDPTAPNGWGYVNRLLQLTSDTLIDVCWQSCGPCIIYGCTDSLACNYNSTATVDDGSCLLIYGCMNPTALNFNPLATCPDSCSFFQIIFGCIDILACNYDFLANTDDGSCLLNYGCMDLLAFNYDSLATCFDSSCVYEYHVTFQLDLRNQTSISYTTPELNGTFNGWCGNCAPMTDANNDSIWEITVPILEGSGPVSGVPGWEYKFSADNWNIQENLFSGDPCTYSASGFTNRYLNVTQDTILDPVCWESCVDCFGPQSSYNVTFQIDMTNVTGFSVPEVNGEFNNWCGNCWPMTDINGDNIWEFTTLIDTSLHEYKFSADTWSIQEYLDSSLSCILINYDPTAPNGWGYVNRYLHINSDTILDPVCWEDCFICNTTNVIDIKHDNCIIYPNPTTRSIFIQNTESVKWFFIYNKLGERIFKIDNLQKTTEINLSNQAPDIYFIEFYNGKQIVRKKIIKM